MPGSEQRLLDANTCYVVHLPADERRVDNMIVAELRERGINAVSVESGQAPADADVVVTYQDKWMWDMTMYMIELRMQFREAEQGGVLATGQSTRTSLVRKSPEGMVEEVLNEIFAKFDQSRVQKAN